MQIIPAIDIQNGRCVRLLRGEFDAVTVYTDDLTGLAQRYADAGCSLLHVVDLDGAERGNAANRRELEAIAADTALRVQTGGGIRSRDDVERLLAAGVSRVVIGSLAISEPQTVRAWLADFGAERIVLALDVRIDTAGTATVVTHGWTRASAFTLDEALALYTGSGLRHVLCTDVDRDGALAGPNVALYRRLAADYPAIRFQASGGVRDSGDLATLAEAGAAAAVTGKALLEGRIELGELAPFLRGA